MNWSWYVIVDVIVAPEPVVEPLKWTPNERLPELFTKIAALEEVNEVTAALLCWGE